MTRRIDHTALDYSQWSLTQRLLIRVIRAFFRLVARIDAEGLENFPASGPYLVAVNHLSMMDIPLFYSIGPTRAVCVIADRWKKYPIINGFLLRLCTPIYIARGQGDRRAIVNALKVLRAGGVIGIAPEGTISRTGGLIQANPGFILMATQAPALIVPVVAYGQERAFHFWKKLRRVPIRLRVGPPIELPRGRLRGPQLQDYTDFVMTAIAKMLPPEYRGVYTGAC